MTKKKKKWPLVIVEEPEGQGLYEVRKKDVTIGYIWHDQATMRTRIEANGYVESHYHYYKSTKNTIKQRKKLALYVSKEHNKWKKDHGLKMLKLVLV